MQHLEVSGAVRLIYESLGFKGLIKGPFKAGFTVYVYIYSNSFLAFSWERNSYLTFRNRASYI